MVTSRCGRFPAWQDGGPVIKAFRVDGKFRVPDLSRFRGASALLLDGFQRGTKGGTGRAFEWDIALRAGKYGRIVLAGGLTPDNVAAAIAAARPSAVDVASGVESRSGKKDPAKVRAFVEAAYEAFARLVR